MSLCFRGNKNGLGRVVLLTGAFCATFTAGYLLAGPRAVEEIPAVKAPVLPVVSTSEPTEPKESCDIPAQTVTAGDGKLNILSKPRATYTDAARANQIQGKVALRVTFGADGKIGPITPISELPDGLTETAIAAAKGIKFAPAMKDGKATTVTKIVEYTFTIY